ncbi:MAG: hypothetical protein ACRDVL_01210 [Acidimicrobiia bacterium]
MGARRGSLTIGVYGDLISSLEEREIAYCVLKGTHHLAERLEGHGDLDLLTDPSHLAEMWVTLLELGFKPARRLVAPQAPAQWHYFRPGVAGGWGHIHLHSAVVCSEQLRTSHLLPSMTQAYLTRSGHVDGVRVPDPGAEYAHLILKVFVRFASIPDLALLLTGRWNPWPEIAAVRSRSGIVDAIQVLDEAGIEVSPRVLTRCDRALARGRLTVGAIFLGLAVRRGLADSRVSSWPRRLFDYVRIGVERLGRAFHGRGYRVPRHGGMIAAVVGPDAVGKSTVVSGLASRFATVYRVSVLHGGKPAVTWRTLPLRIARNLWRLVRRRSDSSAGAAASSASDRPSLVQALNAWALAMERRATLAKATREAARGSLVLFDRYPSQVRGGMDGPRLSALSTASGVGRWLSDKESEIYAGFIPPDLVIRLSAPVADLLDRDATRTKPDGDSYLRLRASPEAGWGMDRECRVVDLTTTDTPDVVQDRVVAEIWKVF